MSTEFNFDAVNNATRNMSAGQKLAVAQGLLSSAINTLERFKNPLHDEAAGLGEELRTFRIKYKEAALKAQEERKAA